MSDFIFNKTDLDGVMIITPKQFLNENGKFEKNFEKEVYKRNGILFEIIEEYKLISDKGVLRGIHFQDPAPQARLISVLSGEALVAVVDLRRDSNRLGEWRTHKVNNINKSIIYVPKGFGVGTLTIENGTVIEVKCSGQYYEENSKGIRYNDADLNIDWKIETEDSITISEKDRALMSFQEYMTGK